MADARQYFDTGFKVLENTTAADFADKAAKRMQKICATPEEQALYKYNPNGARDNLAPGIPLENYIEPMD